MASKIQKSVWNVAGITRDNRNFRIMDNLGDLVALVPVFMEDPDSIRRAEGLAKQLAANQTALRALQAVLRWDERQDKEHRLPRIIEKEVIAALAKSEGRI
jgi:hypothetical protein